MSILIAIIMIAGFSGLAVTANTEHLEIEDEPPSTMPVEVQAKSNIKKVKEPEAIKAEVHAVKATPTPEPTATPTPTVKPQPIDSKEYYPIGGGITGKVSYYSRAGCIGCSPNMITASGEPLDDSKFTLAVIPGQFPMGTMVLVTNLNSGKQAIAKVNDTGGFAKYGRIADLSLALYEFLNAKTDESIIMIEPVTK